MRFSSQHADAFSAGRCRHVYPQSAAVAAPPAAAASVCSLLCSRTDAPHPATCSLWRVCSLHNLGLSVGRLTRRGSWSVRGRLLRSSPATVVDMDVLTVGAVCLALIAVLSQVHVLADDAEKVHMRRKQG